MSKILFIFNGKKRNKMFSHWGGFGYELKDCYEGDCLKKWGRFIHKYKNVPSFGFISYELLYNFREFRNVVKSNSKNLNFEIPLIWWGVFNKSALNLKFAIQNAKWLRSYESKGYFELTSNLTSNISHTEYIRKVKTIKNYISRGDVYQVNLSFRIDGKYEGSTLYLYRYMDNKFYLPYSIFFSSDKYSFTTLSPELFLLKVGDDIYTRPIKGTLARTKKGVKYAKEYFENSVKDKRELDMIIDVERNDFYRICDLDSVKVVDKRVEIFPNVHHQVATIKGRLRSGVTLAEIIENSFPSSSVTGAPKSSAIKIINELEPHKRYIYTGGIGFHYKDTFLLALGIRSILFRGNNLHIYTGSGITYLSNPEEELRECEAKINNYKFLLEELKIGNKSPKRK